MFAFKFKVSITIENDAMKLSVKEAKLIGFGELGTVTIQLVLILKFAFQPEKFAGLSRNRPLDILPENVIYG